MELEAEGVQEGRGEGGLDEVAERLRGLLDEIQARQRVRTGRSGADHDLKSEGESEGKTAPARAEAPGQHEDVTRNKHAHSSRPDPSTLGTIAAFDTRLATLEATLGCSSASPADALQAPVQPTLDRLAAQIRLLSETTPARLDQLNKQIQALTESSEKLVRLRSVARSAADELQTARERELRLASMTRSSSPVKRSVRPGGGAGSLQISGLGNRAESELPSEPSILADPEALQKVRVLHELLPTINDIAPVLPGLVRRLQSLRLIHDGAGSVKDELDELEGRQAGLKGEIAEWTSGLARLEASLKDAAGAAELNAGHMQESIARLEERMKTLS